MADQKKGFYLNLRNRFKDWVKSRGGKENKWSDFLLFTPDLFHLLYKLSLDKEVPLKEKARLASAITYFILPLDLVPEALTGPAGYVDDIALAAFVLNAIMSTTKPEIIKKYWAGSGDILEVLKEILKVADEMIGNGIWKKLKSLKRHT